MQGLYTRDTSIFGPPPLFVRFCRDFMASTAGPTWIALNKPKRVWLADDDPALPPEQLKARLRERAKAARRKERETKLALGLPPEDPPKGGRPTSAAVKPQTLQRRKRKAKRDAALALVDLELCDFGVVGVLWRRQLWQRTGW